MNRFLQTSLFAFLCLCAAQIAESQQIIIPSSVSVTTSATDLWPASQFIDSSGLPDPFPSISTLFDLPNHSAVDSSNAWATESIDTDYFTSGPQPIFTFTLATPETIDGLLLWGYNASSGDEAKTFEVTLLDNTDTPINTTAYTRTLPQPIGNSPFAFSLPSTENVSKIEITIIDNHFGNGTTGGNRVGLGEVRFLSNSAKITGDVNRDGNIGAIDIASMKTAIEFEAENLEYDLNNDGEVDNIDLSIVIALFNAAGGETVTLSEVTDTAIRSLIENSGTSPGTWIQISQALNGETIFLGSQGDLEISGGKEVFIDASDLISSLTIDANTSINKRNRIFLISESSSLAVYNCVITHGWIEDGNTRAANVGDFGGGILILTSNLILTNCTVSKNQSGNGQAVDEQNNRPAGIGGLGGGICSLEGSSATLTGCLIYKNRTGHGGNGTATENAQSGGAGAGIFSRASILNLNQCTIQSNITGNGGVGERGNGGVGGGISSFYRDVVNLTDCLVFDNHTGNGSLFDIDNNKTFFTVGGNGGGINSSLATLNLTSCTISSNSTGQGNLTADVRGGGIHFGANFGLQINACTINVNQSTFGAGVSTSQDSTQNSLQNSIVANNIGVSQISGTINEFLGNNILSGDPLLAPLGYYGGPTMTMPPLPGSPAIDAALISSLATDQRGFARPIDGDNDGSAIPDIGATEAPNWSNPSNEQIAALWNSDPDGDGHPYGIELAVGANPLIADATDQSKLPSISPAGNTTDISFGRNTAAPAGTEWTLYRSTDLSSFTPIYRFDGASTTFEENGNSSDLTDPALFQITDNDSPNSKAFYRLETQYTP